MRGHRRGRTRKGSTKNWQQSQREWNAFLRKHFPDDLEAAEEFPDDPLSAPRGCLRGMFLGALLWLGLGAALAVVYELALRATT